jgi:peptide chain release factor subunit 1
MSSSLSADPQLARYQFRRMLEEVEACEGRGTELVTLYVPPGRAIPEVLSYLRNEYAQAENIKSRVTRKNVTGALETLMNKVRQYKQAPPNGVAFFVGAKAVGSDRTESVAYVIEPPEPLNTYLYRCDSHFYTEPLRTMIHEPELWGLIVIDRAEVTFGWLKGKRIEPLRTKESHVPSKHGRGGQSQHRFERLIEHAAHEFFVRAGEIATELFLPQKDSLKGILVGGPGSTKDYFVDQGFLHYELQKKVVRPLFDVGYTDEHGLKELVEAASTTLHNLEITEEKVLIQKLLSEIRKAPHGLAAYGERDVRRALEAGAVETLLVSEGIRRKRYEMKCTRCGEALFRVLEPSETAQLSSLVCPKCGGTTFEKVSVQDHVTELFDAAARYGAAIRMISTESEEGEMLLKAFEGLGAILRYPLG